MAEDKPELIFTPGCFDDFEGTQEELDAFIKEITDLAESGELFEKMQPLSLDEMDAEELEMINGLLKEEPIRQKLH